MIEIDENMIEVTSPGYPRALRSLAFPVGFVFAVVVHRSLKGVEAVGPRHIFLAFILLYALQGMIVGLRFGYGVDGLVLVQPVTASMMAPLAFLAFRSLAGAQPKRAFLHAADHSLSALRLPSCAILSIRSCWRSSSAMA